MNFELPHQRKNRNGNNVQLYKAPGGLKLNQWALDGQWKDEDQVATSLAADAGLSFRFHARDLHLVLRPPSGGEAVRFRVTIDGHAPGSDHGVDTDADGYGTVMGDRLYQLIRQRGNIQDRTFRIEFLTRKCAPIPSLSANENGRIYERFNKP